MSRVLLYSTGLDSELYRLLEKPEMLLFFKSGARYEHLEEKQLKSFVERGLLDGQEVLVDDTLNFKSLEGSNSIVPMRNIFYILRAFEYTNDVLIGVTYYDLHYDKQTDVLSSLTGFVQNYYYFREYPDTWNDPMPRILTPYRDLTKGQLLKLAIDKGLDVSHIPTLRTCYDGESEKGCGICKSCVSKAMALAVNGVFKPEYFDKDPRKIGKKWIKSYRKDCTNTIDVNIFDKEVEILLGS